MLSKCQVRRKTARSRIRTKAAASSIRLRVESLHQAEAVAARGEALPTAPSSQAPDSIRSMESSQGRTVPGHIVR